MKKKNENTNESGAGTSLLEHLRSGFLEAIGGQDLRNSGFENEEPDPEYGGRDESWCD